MTIPIDKRNDVRRAADDVRNRTLATIRDPIERLVYVASMRDYNTGVYYHAGLAMRFGDEVAGEALADCHREAYRHLVATPLKGIVEQLERYANNSGTSSEEFLANWRRLEPYRVAVPAESDPLVTDFMCSNLSIAVSILESRLPAHSERQPGASPRPSPVQ